MLEHALAELEALLAPASAPEARREAVAQAARRARSAARAAGQDDSAHRLAAVGFVANVRAAHAPESSRDRERVGQLVQALARATGIPAAATSADLYLRTLCEIGARDFPPRITVDAVLTELEAHAPVSEVSLWIRNASTGEPQFVGGDGPPRKTMLAAARAVLPGTSPVYGCARGAVHGVQIVRWRRPLGALLFRASRSNIRSGLWYAEEAAAVLAAALEKDLLLERHAKRERALVETGERRLTRLGLDLHDGALQDIAALAGDVGRLRDQLGITGEGRLPREALLGRLDDVDAQLAEIYRDLRDLAHSLESPATAARSLGAALREHAAGFMRRSGIAVDLELQGDFARLTDSQRLALVRIVQEALTNVREHSGARKVTITVKAGRTQTEAVVVDNGRGFEVERTLAHAAERGRLGLVGMAERVRLLGGRFDVESRPGGPTTISAVIPRWEPLARGLATAAS